MHVTTFAIAYTEYFHSELALFFFVGIVNTCMQEKKIRYSCCGIIMMMCDCDHCRKDSAAVISDIDPWSCEMRKIFSSGFCRACMADSACQRALIPGRRRPRSVEERRSSDLRCPT